MLVDTKIIRNKLRELTEKLPSFESAWRAIYEMENYLTELEEGPKEKPETVPADDSIVALAERLKAAIKRDEL